MEKFHQLVQQIEAQQEDVLKKLRRKENENVDVRVFRQKIAEAAGEKKFSKPIFI